MASEPGSLLPLEAVRSRGLAVMHWIHQSDLALIYFWLTPV